MPRIARAIAVHFPHHVTERGNYQYPVFDDDNDFKQYLYWLKNYIWSSAREHIEKTSDDVLTHDCYLQDELNNHLLKVGGFEDAD